MSVHKNPSNSKNISSQKKLPFTHHSLPRLAVVNRMDVPGVLRWLVGANIAIAKAMPLVSTLAAAGVMNPDDIAKLDDGALSAAVVEKASL